MAESAIPAYITSLIRHFADLRNRPHGGSASRKDKEAHYEKAVQLLAPVARQVLTEMNTSLLLDTGKLTETGLRRTADGGDGALFLVVPRAPKYSGQLTIACIIQVECYSSGTSGRKCY